jgi:hypothetical protein
MRLVSFASHIYPPEVFEKLLSSTPRTAYQIFLRPL